MLVAGLLFLSRRAERGKSHDWHRPLLAARWESQESLGLARCPLAGKGLWRGSQLSEADPQSVGGAGWQTSLHSPFVSLAGVKKRTKVIKNSVNPVWNEVGRLSFLPPFRSAAAVSAVTSQGLVQEVAFSVAWSRRRRGCWSRVSAESAWC